MRVVRLSLLQYAEYNAQVDLFCVAGAYLTPSKFFDYVEAFGYDYEQTHGALAIGLAVYAVAGSGAATMKRYEFQTASGWDGSGAAWTEAEESPDGEWVKYEDAVSPEGVAATLRSMTEEQRARTMELVDWCPHCYRLDPRCQCANDE